MLDKNDIKQIGELMDNQLEKFAAKFILPSFQQVENNFFEINKRFEQVDKRFEQVELRLDRIESRLDDIANRLEKLEERVEALEKICKRNSEDTEIALKEMVDIKKILKKNNIGVPKLAVAMN
ncbi:MAG: hypothetical protein V1661_01305 [bacterium]